MSDPLDFVLAVVTTTNITNFTPEDQERVAQQEKEGQWFTSTILTGARLRAVNNVLIRHNFAPMMACSLNEILTIVTPMPVSNLLSFLEEIHTEIDQVQP